MVAALALLSSHPFHAGEPASLSRHRRRSSFPVIWSFSSRRRSSWDSRFFTERVLVDPIRADSRADDSPSSEMSLESALKLLGVSEGASFEEIVRAKNSIIATCKTDQQAISQDYHKKLKYKKFPSHDELLLQTSSLCEAKENS